MERTAPVEVYKSVKGSDSKEVILVRWIEKCLDGTEHFWSDESLALFAHVRKHDDRWWLAHVVPQFNYLPKEEKERFNRELDRFEPYVEDGKSTQFEIFSMAALYDEDVPGTRWIIKDLLPEGLASLAGRPKHGKSWLALNLSIAVAMGGQALQAYEVASPGSVLYLALEDSKARLKGRMQMLMRQVVPWPDNLLVALHSPRIGEGFVEATKAWLEEHPDASLIVIDMYTKVAQRRKKKSNNSEYDDIYDELGPLQELAYEFHVCILIILHLNKTADVEDATSRIMGSTAYSGATVTNLILKRMKDQPADAILIPNGKDIENDDDVALIFDKGIWVARGNASDYNQSKQRVDILRALYTAHGNETTIRDIADSLGKNLGTTRLLFKSMRADGLIGKHARSDTYCLTNLGLEVMQNRERDDVRVHSLDAFEDGWLKGEDSDVPF